MTAYKEPTDRSGRTLRFRDVPQHGVTASTTSTTRRTGDTNAFALATDPDAILDARRDSFACAACGSPDPARLYDGGCSDCRDFLIAYTVTAPNELGAIKAAVLMLRAGVRPLSVQDVTRVRHLWRVRLLVRE